MAVVCVTYISIMLIWQPAARVAERGSDNRVVGARLGAVYDSIVCMFK